MENSADRRDMRLLSSLRDLRLENERKQTNTVDEVKHYIDFRIVVRQENSVPSSNRPRIKKFMKTLR